MKVAAVPATSIATGRIARRVRLDLLSSRTVQRLKDELEHELDAVSLSEQAGEADTRRDALERAVRRIWGATL